MTSPSRRLEPLAQRVRARIGKRIILDTTHAQLLFEDERHPWRAVPKDALRAPLAGPAVADDLDSCSWAIELDGTRHARAVRTWDTHPLTVPPSPASLSSITTSPTNGWKKDTRLRHAEDPYHRVETLASGRHIQVLVNGEPLATTRRPALIIETGMGPAQPQPAQHHILRASATELPLQCLHPSAIIQPCCQEKPPFTKRSTASTDNQLRSLA